MPESEALNRRTQNALAVIAAAGLLLFLREATEVFLPFAVALVLALAFSPVVRWLDRRGVPSALSTTAILVVVLAVITLAILLVESGVSRFMEDLPRIKERVARLSETVTAKLGISSKMLEGIGEGPAATRTLIGIGGSTAASLVEILFQTSLILLYLVFMLLGRRYLPSLLHRSWGKTRGDSAVAALDKIERELFRYFLLRTAVSLVTAGVVAAILLLYGVRFAGLWTVLTFFAQYVPFIGPAALSVLPVLMAIVQFPSLSTAGWIALWLTLWHVLVGLVLEPRVFSMGLSLNQTILLLGIALFGWMWGVVGILIWVPMMVAIRLFARQSERWQPLDVFLGPANPRESRDAPAKAA